MATTTTLTWDNLGSATIGELSSKMRDAISKKTYLLDRLMKNNGTYEGGLFMTEPILKALAHGQSYKGDMAMNPTDVEMFATAVYSPAYYAADIIVNDTDVDENRGPAKVFDLVEKKMMAAQLKLYDLVSTALYGDGTVATYGVAPIVGLAAAVATDPTTGTYANITRDATAATTFWKNTTDTSFTDLSASLTMVGLEAPYALVINGNESPDIIVTGRAEYNRIWSLADDRQRLGNEQAASLGYKSIDFNGTPVIWDSYCPDNILYILNTDNLELRRHSGYSGWIDEVGWLRGTGQLVKVNYWKMALQLFCVNPRYQAVMS